MHQIIQRRVSRQVRIGSVLVGGDAPVMVQSMTNTDTADADGTTRQVFDLARAGSEVVRLTVNSAEAAAAGKSSMQWAATSRWLVTFTSTGTNC